MIKRKRNIYGFNHISVKLKPNEIDKLQNLYKSYHKLFICYQWKYLKLNKRKLALHLSSIALTVTGTITGSVTLNPIIGGSIVGAGVLIQGYLAKSDITNKTSQCRLAYTTYEKLLIRIKSYLRGLDFDMTLLLSDIKSIDEMIVDQCPSADEFSKKYSKKYNPNLPASELIVKKFKKISTISL